MMGFWQQRFHAIDEATPDAERPVPIAPPPDDAYATARRWMVASQLRGRDIIDPRVLDAMGRVPRERFVAEEMRHQAYEDHPLLIGLGQTISQPYIVALTVQLARLTKESRVLDVGVGSGYQTAILAELCEEVHGVEIHGSLADAARRRLAALGYRNVVIRQGDGYLGWPEQSPFDAILVSAAPDHVPRTLLEQLGPGGRLVIPVGRASQDLLLIEKWPDGGFEQTSIAPVQFVPMVHLSEHD